MVHAISDIQRCEHNVVQTFVEDVTVLQVSLERSASGNNEASNVWLVIRDKVLGSKLGDFSYIVVSFFFSYSREAHGGLTTTTVLLWEHNRQALQHLLCIALQRGIQHSVTVDDDEPELIIILEKPLKRLSVEPVLAFVGELGQRKEGLNVDDHLLLSLAIV